MRNVRPARLIIDGSMGLGVVAHPEVCQAVDAFAIEGGSTIVPKVQSSQRGRRVSWEGSPIHAGGDHSVDRFRPALGGVRQLVFYKVGRNVGPRQHDADDRKSRADARES